MLLGDMSLPASHARGRNLFEYGSHLPGAVVEGHFAPIILPSALPHLLPLVLGHLKKPDDRLRHAGGIFWWAHNSCSRSFDQVSGITPDRHENRSRASQRYLGLARDRR